MGVFFLTVFAILMFDVAKVLVRIVKNNYLHHCNTLTKTMKTYIRFKQHKIRLKNIKQIEPQQKYRLGTISNIKQLGVCGGGGLNRFYRTLTAPVVVHNI